MVISAPKVKWFPVQLRAPEVCSSWFEVLSRKEVERRVSVKMWCLWSSHLTHCIWPDSHSLQHALLCFPSTMQIISATYIIRSWRVMNYINFESRRGLNSEDKRQRGMSSKPAGVFSWWKKDKPKKILAGLLLPFNVRCCIPEVPCKNTLASHCLWNATFHYIATVTEGIWQPPLKLIQALKHVSGCWQNLNPRKLQQVYSLHEAVSRYSVSATTVASRSF